MRDKFLKAVILFACIASITLWVFVGIATLANADSSFQHISIVSSKSCILSSTCPDYTALQKIFPQPEFPTDNIIHLKNFRTVCIQDDFCDHFSGITNNTVWLDITEPIGDMHVLTLVPSPMITHVSQLTAGEKRIIHDNIKLVQENYDDIIDEIKDIDKTIAEHKRLIIKNTKDTSKLNKEIRQLYYTIESKEDQRNGLGKNDEKLQTLNVNIDAARTDIENKLYTISLLKSQIIDYKLIITNYKNDKTLTHAELRNNLTALDESQNQLKPNQLDGNRILTWNTYALYVNPTCSYSSFYPQNATQIKQVTDYIFSGCMDKKLLVGIQQEYTQQLENTEIKINDSANWQYLQWVKNVTNSLRDQ